MVVADNPAVREALESLYQSVLVFGADRRLVFANDRALKTFDLDDTLGQPGTPYDAIVSALRDSGHVDPQMADPFVDKSVVFECERDSGQLLEVRLTPLSSGGVSIQARDVTAQYEALKAVGRSEKHTRDILDMMIDTFFRLDSAGRVVMLSHSIDTLLGYTPRDLLGVPLADLFEISSLYNDFTAALEASDGHVNSFETPMVHRDGRKIWVATSARIIFDEDGKAVGIEGTCRDVTKEKRAQVALSESQETLTREVEERTHHLHREIAERRQTEEALRVSEERYALAMEAAREGMWDLDVDSDRLFLSARFREIVGTDEAWMSSKDFMKTFIVPKDKASLRQRLIAHLKGETPQFEFDARVNIGGDDTKVRWIRNRAVAVRDASGHAYRMVGAVTDITDSRIMERALRNSEQRFRDIVEAASDWFWELDGELKFDFVSDRFFLLSGLDRSILRGRRFDDLIDAGIIEADKDLVQANLAELTTNKPFRDFEVSVVKSDGRRLHARLSGRPFFADDGKFLGYRGVGTDITRQVEAERRAMEAQQRLRDAIETISEAFVLFDASDRLVAYNSKYPSLYADIADVIRPGMSFENIVRCGVERGLYVDSIGREEAWIKERLERHANPVGALENELSNGRWVRVTERRMPDGGIVGIRSDITQLKSVQQELEEAHATAQDASKAKSDFLANMSHELRTPLNAIMGFSDAMRSEIFGKIGSPQYEDYVQAIHQSGQHLLEVIEDILDVAKIEAGKLEMHEENINVPETAVTCLRLLDERAKLGAVSLHNLVDPNLPEFYGDRRRLRQIFLNLLSNAVKFTPEGGDVYLESVLSNDGGLVFRVRDSGIGMNADELHRAMEPFGQAESAQARKYEGTGLGLPLVEGLVAHHGGTLAMESKPGEGTLVTVTFPSTRTLEPGRIAPPNALKRLFKRT